jgi:hypothetical protein
MPNAAPTRGRDAYIDALRGACILAMAFFHLAVGTWAIRFTFAGSVGFFNGAEGFVFLSGLVFGRVYQRKLRELGPAVAGRAVYRRVGQIYRWHLLLLLCLLCIGWLFPTELRGGGNRFGLAIEAPWTALWKGALLVYQPDFFDILPLYIAFLPLAWLFIRRGLLRTPWLPIASVALWACQQVPATAFGGPITRGAFNPAAYQVLFVFGLWFAAQPETGTVYRALRDVRLAAVSIVVALVGFVLAHPRHLGLPGEVVLALLRFGDADKVHLGWLRALDFLAVAHVAYYFREQARRLPLGALASLGRRSLEVFAAHLAWLLILRPINYRIFHEAGPSVYGAYVMATIIAGTFAVWAWDARKVQQVGAPRLAQQQMPG